MIPSTHKKSIKEFKLATHNCCAETLLERPIYASCFKRGQRCIVPADGFYEWSSKKRVEKIPHFVHLKDKSDKLLLMAGLYDKCNLSSEEGTLYSIAIITVAASDSISWLHHRMPVYISVLKIESLL